MRGAQEAFRDERLDILAGTRGAAGKRAVRLDEMPDLVAQTAAKMIAAAGTGSSGGAVIRPATGLFIGNGTDQGALGTQNQVANRTVIAPFAPTRDVRIDQLGVSISTAVAGALFKAIIYNSDELGRPLTVLIESGNIDAASTGTKFATIAPVTLAAGKTYWIGIRSSSTATLRTLAVASSPVLAYTNAATPVAQGVLILTETFANAAAPWVYASGQHSNALVPLVLMRVA